MGTPLLAMKHGGGGMRLRRRRRRGAVETPPLTPAQVKRQRERGALMQSRTVAVFILTSALCAIAVALLFNAGSEGGHHFIIAWSAVMAVAFLIALGYARNGAEDAASVVVLLLSAISITLVVSETSAGLSLESYLFGLAVMPFVLIRRERPMLRLAVAAVIVALYLTCELVWPEGRGAQPFDDHLAHHVAQLNRIGAATLFTVALVLVETRRASMMRVLAGAARYGELRATTDELTGVYNRRPVIAQLSEWAARGRGNYAIALIDLDHFKTINDQFGHDCGDTIIQAVATTLRGHFRDSDMVSRWGGDEFLVVMPGVRHADLVPILERLRRAIALIEKRCINGHIHTVTVSIGAAMGAIGRTPDECIAAADHALYRAKEEGRNRVVAVGSAEPTQALGRPDIEELEPWVALAPDAEQDRT